MIMQYLDQSAAIQQGTDLQSQQQYVLTYFPTAGTSFQASQRTIARVVFPTHSAAFRSQIWTIMTEIPIFFAQNSLTQLENVSLKLQVPLLLQ